MCKPRNEITILSFSNSLISIISTRRLHKFITINIIIEINIFAYLNKRMKTNNKTNLNNCGANFPFAHNSILFSFRRKLGKLTPRSRFNIQQEMHVKYSCPV